MLLLYSYVFPYGFSSNQALVNFFPVLGAILIIFFSRPDNLSGKILSIKPLTFLGLISYSAYLWHQPLIAFVRLASSEPPHYLVLLLFSLCSLPLAYLSWKYVENYYRDRRLLSARRFYGYASGCVAVLLLLGFSMHRTFGFQELWPDLAYGNNPQVYVDKPRLYKKADFGDGETSKLLVVGNSFARDFINILIESGRENAVDLVYFEGECSTSERRTLERLLKQTEFVVYASNWAQAGFDNDLLLRVKSCYDDLASLASGKVYVLGVKNFGWNNDFVKHAPQERENIRVKPLESVVAFNQMAKKSLGNAYLDLLGLMQSADGTVPVFSDDGRFITYDSNHLTKSGAIFVGKHFFEAYDFLE